MWAVGLLALTPGNVPECPPRALTECQALCPAVCGIAAAPPRPFRGWGLSPLRRRLRARGPCLRGAHAALRPHPRASGPHLVAAGAPRPHALAVVAAAPGRAVLPEVDEVHQRLGALGAHEAGGVPLLAVAGPVRVHHGAVGGRHALAEFADLGAGGRPVEARPSERTGTGQSVPSGLPTPWRPLSMLLCLSLSFPTCKVRQ